MSVEIIERPPIQLVTARNPLAFESEARAIAAGPTIADLLREAGIPPWAAVRVYLNGDLVYPEYYRWIRPKPGSHVLIRAVAKGGGGGGQGKNIGTIIAGILLIIVGLVLGIAEPYGMGWTQGVPLIVAGAGLLISGVINLLIPPPTPPKLRPLAGLAGQDAESPTLSIAGQTNEIRRYGVVPRLFGRHRIYPPYAALPYTEVVGSDQYVRLLFCIGLGETEIEDLRLGETPLSNFTGVELETRTGAAGEPPITLYANAVIEDPLAVTLTQAGGRQVRTSATDAAELSISIAFPQGLVTFQPDGSKATRTVSVTVEYRLAGQNVWVPAPASPLVTTEARQAMVRAGMRWKPQRPVGSTPGSAWTAFGLASFDAAKINDGVLNVLAFDADAAAAGSWLRFDSGLGLSNEFGRVLVTSAGTGANATWDVQYSDDGVTWTTVVTGFSTGAAASEAATWAPDGRHRFWRLLKTNGAVVGPDYYEVDWWRTTVGQYDVGLTRTTADNTDPQTLDATVWSALRAIRLTPAVTMPAAQPIALVAMRIKATDQLSGVVADFNCIASSRIRDWVTYSGSVLSDLPLGYWRLGEVAGAPTAFDGSGHGRSGIYQGAPTLGAAGLLVDDLGTSMACDGIDDRVTGFTGLTAIDMGAMSFTVEAVIRATNLTGNRGIVHKGDGLEFTTGHVGWALIRAGNVVRFTRAIGSGAPTLVDSPTISADTTYHVAVIYDFAANTARMVLNGNPQAPVSMPAGIYADSFGLEISHASDNTWEGRLQEVAIYPSALSTTRIAADYQAAQGTREWRVQRTSNPASHYREVLQGVENARPVADARVDLPAIQDWHKENSAGGRSANLVVDYKTTVIELLRDIAACGRATPTANDGKHATVRDLAQTVPRQHFTPRNSRNWQSHLAIIDEIHAIKVRFVDAAAGWQQSERIVYADGFSAANATRFEVLELHGVTDPDHAWRMGRYHLAVATLRRESSTFETDIEHLVCRRGDLVHVAHDVLESGLAWARIKAITATSMTTDEALPMAANQNYGVRIRLSDGSSRLATLVTAPGEQTTVSFLAPLSAPLPAVGDLVLFGILGLESSGVLVSRIEPGPDYSARLVVVPAAPGVLTADQGAIPPWNPQMTVPPLINRDPPTPIPTAVVSDETVLLRDLDGSLRSRIVVTLAYVATSNVAADYLEARWRRSGSGAPYDALPQQPPDADQVSFTSVEDGVAYDLRLRTVNRDGPTSPWTNILGHVVIGKSTPPIAPVKFRREGNALAWDYPTPPPDLDGFEVRRSPGASWGSANWQTALEMHVGLVFSPFTLPSLIYGLWTFLVAAADVAGNASAPATLIIDFGSPVIHNQVATFDYDAAGYPGTITNGSVQAGDLKADQLSTGFWTQDGNLFWSASGSTLFWQGIYKQMTYQFSYTTGANAAGTTMLFATTVVAVSWSLFYRIGTSGDFLPWPGVLPGILASQQYDFKLITDAGSVQGIVSQLVLYLDAEDQEELHQNFATAVTTGSRLTLQKTYRAIKAVEATVLASGVETAITAIAADQQNTQGAGNGPLIKSYDAAGAVVAGHVNAVVKGY